MVAELSTVTKRYGAVTALDGVTLSLTPKGITAVLGPNGAGKTTAVRLLLGLTQPTSGRATLFGGDPRAVEARRRTGVMLQIATVPETLKVREHVDLFRSYYPAPLPAEAVLSTAGLVDVAERKFGELSGGQRQRLLFALAICGNPDVLFLDEPTVGLDVEARRQFWQEVRRLASRGCSVVLTTHYLEEADALADRIVVLNHGRIVADGAPHEIKNLAAARKVRCVTTVSHDYLRSLPVVQSLRNDGAAIEILTNDAESLARELLARDARLSGLEIIAASLEEAFLTLTATSRSHERQAALAAGGIR
jgi:ABC-2 type transport system ATP-binding protein